jgi:hypothetical protein
MQKVLNIALKDLLLTLRDPGALVIMLLAPLALTLAISAALGNSGGSSGGLQHIPVILVNQDQGVFGEYLVQAFSSKEVGDLVQATEMNDAAAAKVLFQDGRRAVIVRKDRFCVDDFHLLA